MTIQYVEGQFVDSYDPTIENSKSQRQYLYFLFSYFKQNGILNFNSINFHRLLVSAFAKNIKYKGQEFHLELVDTAGQVGEFLF